MLSSLGGDSSCRSAAQARYQGLAALWAVDVQAQGVGRTRRRGPIGGLAGRAARPVHRHGQGQHVLLALLAHRCARRHGLGRYEALLVFASIALGVTGIGDVRRITVALKVEGPEGFVMEGSSSLAKISRDPLELGDAYFESVGLHGSFWGLPED